MIDSGLRVHCPRRAERARLDPITRITGNVFGNRLAGILQREGYSDLREFDGKSHWVLLRIPQIGKKSLKRIRDAMGVCGLAFKDD